MERQDGLMRQLIKNIADEASILMGTKGMEFNQAVFTAVNGEVRSNDPGRNDIIQQVRSELRARAARAKARKHRERVARMKRAQSTKTEYKPKWMRKALERDDSHERTREHDRRYNPGDD